MKRYGLRDDQFARIEALLPGRPGTVGRNSELGNRLFRRGGDLEIPRRRRRGAICRSVLAAGEYPQALFALGRERRLGESFQGLGR